MEKTPDNIVRTYLPWLPVLGLLMVISALPYGWSAYQGVGCYTLAIGYGLYWIGCRRWHEIRWERSKWMYVVMIALWAMIPLRQLFDATPPTDYYMRQMHGHIWMVYVGVVGIMGFPKELKMKYVVYVMLLTSAVMLGHCLYLYYGTTEMETLAPFLRFNTLRRTYIHSHMVMNLYVNAALAMSFCVLRSLPEWWKKGLLLLAMGVAAMLILLSDGRNGLFATLVIGSVSMVYYISRRINIWAGVAATLLLAGVSVAVLMNQPRINKEKLAMEPRFAIWDYSWRLIKEKPVFGFGLSTLSEEYVERAYTDKVMYHQFVVPVIRYNSEFREQGKTMDTHHPHNAFMMYWLAIGIGGLLLFCALFVTAACLPVGKNRIFLLLFLFTLWLQCMTEPVGTHLPPQLIALMLFVWESTAHSTHPSGTEITPAA